MTQQSATPENFHILLIDDNEADFIITKKIFERSAMPNTIHTAQDGDTALEYLRDATTPSPNLIFLDMNMPGKDGKEVLREIKADEDLKHIPVIMMTSSCSEKEVMECYQSHANSYILKPKNLEDNKALVQALESFWFNLAVLPAA